MRPATLLILVFFMSACASIDDSKKTITFDNATRRYEQALRWGDFQTIDSFRRHSDMAPAEQSRLGSVRVTSYDTVGTTESPDRTRVMIDVVIGYYNEYTMKEVSITDHQSWEYDPAEQAWFITSPLPDFK